MSTCYGKAQAIEAALPEAVHFAEENCKITRELEPYESEHEYRCTSEDYSLGAKESYSPNSYLAHCRHSNTNYDELIKSFDKSDMNVVSQLRYQVIRDRIHHVIRVELERREANGDEDVPDLYKLLEDDCLCGDED